MRLHIFHNWSKYEEPQMVTCMYFRITRLRAFDDKWCQKRTCEDCGKVMWKRV